jgi:predicted membrane protein
MAIRYWFGSLLILLGVGALVDQIRPFGFGALVSIWWPLAVILLGGIMLITRAAPLVGSIIVLGLGLLFQISTLGFYSGNIWDLIWPSLLILLGAGMMLRLGRFGVSSARTEDTVQHFVLFSGMETRYQSANFRGGAVTGVFGGADVDLRECKMADSGAVLDLTAAFGGVTIKVPGDWKVDVDGLPLFGGWSNHTVLATGSGSGPVLKVRCLAMFGGIDIKN